MQSAARAPLRRRRFSAVFLSRLYYNIGAEKRKNGKTGLRKTDLKNGKNEIPEHVGFAFGSYIRFSRAVFQPFSTPGKTPVFQPFFSRFFSSRGNLFPCQVGTMEDLDWECLSCGVGLGVFEL